MVKYGVYFTGKVILVGGEGGLVLGEAEDGFLQAVGGG